MKNLVFLFLLIGFSTFAQTPLSEKWNQNSIRCVDANGELIIKQHVSVWCEFSDENDLSSLTFVNVECSQKENCSPVFYKILEPIYLYKNPERIRFLTSEDEITIYRDVSGDLVVIVHQLNGVDIFYTWGGKRT